MDLAVIGKAAGVDLEQLMQANQQNPGDMLQALKGVGESSEVGHETIRGGDTTHYHADIDMKKAIDQVSHDERLEQMLQSTGLSTMPVDVWIDGSGRVARQSMKFSASGVSMDMTIDYTRFGVPVDVTPPPADQVMDAGALLGAAGATNG
jgi:hypothetical protein